MDIPQDIFQQRLLAPFSTADLQIRAGSWSPQGNQPLVYIDTRTAQERLNLIPNHNVQIVHASSTQFQIEKDKFKKGSKTEVDHISEMGYRDRVAITIITDFGTRSNVGESDSDPNSFANAYSQAFKRACSGFGIGTYLYDLKLSPKKDINSTTVPGILASKEFQDNHLKALRANGFKFRCEVTEGPVTVEEAAHSVKVFGRVLNTEGMQKVISDKKTS